jgi:hypothetical protein
MRRTFVTKMARLGTPIEIRNRLTNHSDPSIDSRYNKHDYWTERLTALKKWDRKLDRILKTESVGANVVQLSKHI